MSAHINDAPKSAREGLHAMTTDVTGGGFATWLDLRNKGTELWGAASSDGARTRSFINRPTGTSANAATRAPRWMRKAPMAVMWRS